MSGGCLNDVWKVSELCLGGVCKVSGRCLGLEDVVKMSSWCLDSVWKVFEMSLEWRYQCCAVSPPEMFPQSTKYVRCPPLPVYTFSVRCPPPHCSFVPLTHALSWILSKGKNLASSSLNASWDLMSLRGGYKIGFDQPTHPPTHPATGFSQSFWIWGARVGYKSKFHLPTQLLNFLWVSESKESQWDTKSNFTDPQTHLASGFLNSESKHVLIKARVGYKIYIDEPTPLKPALERSCPVISIKTILPIH